MEKVQFGTLMYLMKEVDELCESVLPVDYVTSEADIVDADLQEDFVRVNLLILRLKAALENKDKEQAELILAEVIALVSGIEGFIRNIVDDARDILKGKYRFA